MDPAHPAISPEELPSRVGALPGLDALRDAASGLGIYLVGGSVRDLLLGADRVDVDVAVEGDAIALAERLGGELTSHGRFGTATATVAGHRVDLATCRRESYPSPGALPEVSPASISEDLARRDFTVNAMAVPLDREPVLLDPHGGLDDLRAGLLRVLHPRSFADDPTRALRAARYAARLGFELDPATEAALVAADLETVSDARVEGELSRLASEPSPAAVLGLLDDWGILGSAPGVRAAADRLVSLARLPPWEGLADVRASFLGLLSGAGGDLAARSPGAPSEVDRLASRARPEELLAARARGAEWLDEWAGRLRRVTLPFDGSDLLAAGIPRGPAVGRGLDAARAALLDGKAHGHDELLEVALRAARG